MQFYGRRAVRQVTSQSLRSDGEMKMKRLTQQHAFLRIDLMHSGHRLETSAPVSSDASGRPAVGTGAPNAWRRYAHVRRSTECYSIVHTRQS